MANEPNNALIAVKLRYEFYRDGYRKLLMIILNLDPEVVKLVHGHQIRVISYYLDKI